MRWMGQTGLYSREFNESEIGNQGSENQGWFATFASDFAVVPDTGSERSTV